jgi:histone acetyltransferase 1
MAHLQYYPSFEVSDRDLQESFKPFPEFKQSVLDDASAKDFKPPGKLVHSYTKNERNYEIWAGSLADPEVQALLDRIQIFVSLFIEAGTPIETHDFEWTLERWTVYFVCVILNVVNPLLVPRRADFRCV